MNSIDSKQKIIELVSNSLIYELLARLKPEFVNIRLGDIPNDDLAHVKQLVEANAGQVISEFQDNVLTERVRSIIVDDVRSALTKATRIDRAIDIAIYITNFVVITALGIVATMLSVGVFAQESLDLLNAKRFLYLVCISALFSVFQIILLFVAKYRR